jgi:hypothetical protein
LYIYYSFRRMALQQWKQKKGSQATAQNLIRAFENVGYQAYADNVKTICGVSGGGGVSFRAVAVTDMGSSDNPPSLPRMFKILLPLSSHWMNIGVMLSLSHGQLTAFETKCRGVPDNCLREMLSAWLKQTDPRPTKSALVDAVEMYDPSLAEKISAL